jgi:hypothetical protein
LRESLLALRTGQGHARGGPPPSGKRGRNRTFSDAAIQFCLSSKCLFGQPLRQALGIDAQTLEIRAIEVTSNAIAEAPMLPQLLPQMAADERIASACADGAYDTPGCPDWAAYPCPRSAVLNPCRWLPWHSSVWGWGHAVCYSMCATKP